MASKSSASVLSLFLALNLLFFASVSACGSCTSSKPKLEATPPEGAAPPEGACPRDALKFGVCANLLGSLLNINIGTPPNTPCCSLIEGLADLEAAVCVCTAIKANVLGIINLDVPLSLSLLLNACSKQVPSDFQCA